MRLRMPAEAARWAQRLLTGCGISLIAYCGFVVSDAWWFQRVESAAFAPVAVTATAPRPSATKGVIGRIVIDRLGLSVMVLEGTSALTLRRAAGHIAGTALPGQRGNVGISGHRDTFFRSLQNIRRDDLIAFTTGDGKFRYRVTSVTVVLPTDVEVLAGSERQVLTLVTCYPFTFIGSAPERYIVRAERVI